MNGFTIIGAGQAGANAASAMRAAGYQGEITLIGDEVQIPYERPPLSKGILTGNLEPKSANVFNSTFYEENRISLLTSTRVEAIDVAAKQLQCGSAGTLNYEKLLIATGSRVRKLNVPGGELEGVHYLRSLADTLSFSSALRNARHLVVIGGGYLGLEVSASARKMGLEVVVLEREDNILARVAPTEISRFVADLHISRGVDIRCGVDIQSIDGDSQVASITLGSGEVIPADLVFIGVGGIPNVEVGTDCRPGHRERYQGQ